MLPNELPAPQGSQCPEDKGRSAGPNQGAVARGGAWRSLQGVERCLACKHDAPGKPRGTE